MEKINIAELLKDCPQGMELDCTMFDNVSFLRIQNGTNQIIIRTPNGLRFLNSYGCYHDDNSAKCVIFPKGKKNWEGFVPPCQFKDGDILATDLGSVFYLNTRLNTDGYYGCYVGIGGDGTFHIYEPFAYKECCGLATKEEKEKLFQAIKDNGYQWNAETKTLEKLIIPKFKVGDKVRGKYTNNIYTISRITSTGYELTNGQSFTFNAEDCHELVPNKFDINALKPYDKVLVRLTNDRIWKPKFFSHYDPKVKYYPFVTLDNMGYPQCIPYNGNEHLRRTTNNCDEFYRVWEK